MKYFIPHLIPVLAPNYKQHILSPAKVRKNILLINWTLYQICLFEIMWVEGGVKFMKLFKVGGKLENSGNL
jgi:hypothetical protein